MCYLGWSWRRRWHPTPVLLPGKSHGRRSLVGCSPWGCEESDMPERLHFHFSLSCIGEGNGNPLQCSCLENPRDGRAWWAAIYGVAQSRTQLKQLSSSSSSKGSGARTLSKWKIQIQQSISFICSVHELIKQVWQVSFHVGWRQSFKWCLSKMHNLVIGHGASDIHPKVDYSDNLQKQT